MSQPSRSSDAQQTGHVSIARRRPRHSGFQSWRRRSLGGVILFLAVATAVTGLAGFTAQYFAAKSQPAAPTGLGDSDGSTPRSPEYDLTIPMFRTVQLFLLDSGAEDDANHPDNALLAVARIFAAVLFFVVSWTAIEQVVTAVRRLPRQLTRRDHVVICGLGQIGLRLLDDLHEAGRSGDVVVIEKNHENPWLEYARSLNATIVLGDASRPETLGDARAAYAKEVFIVSGDDGVNLEVSAELGLLLQERPEEQRSNKLSVYVHIVDVNLALTLRPHCARLHDTGAMSVRIFNVPRTAASRLTVQQLWPFAPRRADQVAHFVIVGFGPMAQTLAVQLASLAHFANRKRCRLTIADEKIQSTATRFLHRFPRFTSWTDGLPGVTEFSEEADQWEWNQHPLPDDIRMSGEHAIQYVCNAEFCELPSGRSDERFAKHLASRFANSGVKPVIFVCGHDDHHNFETAVELREHMAQFDCPDVPIFVWLPQQPALAEVLQRDGTVMPFGECATSASYDEIVNPAREVMGRIIHDDYQQQGLKAGWTSKAESWEVTPDEFQESSRAAADHMHIKLAACGFRLVRRKDAVGPRITFNADNEKTQSAKTILAEMEHNRWVAERLLVGWRYAPAANSDEVNVNKKKRLNKNIVSWDQLGSEERKDFDQIDVVLRECQKLKDFQIDWVDGRPTNN